MSANFAFIHGGGQGSWVWDDVIAALAVQSGDTARCIALDAPGCGTKRGRDTSAISYAGMLDEFTADLAASGLSDIVLVGHSQAGMVLPGIIARRHDLIRHAAYLSCSAPLPGKTTLDQMGLGLHGQYHDQVGWPLDPVTTDMELRLRTMFCNDMQDFEADSFMAKLGQDMWPSCCYSESDWRYDHLGAVPSSFILCLQDMALPAPWQHRFAERLKVERTITLDAGHQAMNSRPQALAEILLKAF